MRKIIAASVLVTALAVPALADESDPECPAAFQGARVSVSKIADGVAIEFTAANRSFVGDMREQLREVADMLEQKSTHVQTASMTDDVEFPPVDLAVKDTTLGARVIVRAGRFHDVPALRNLAFGFEKYWKQSKCTSAD